MVNQLFIHLEKVIIFDANIKFEHDFRPFSDNSKINFLQFSDDGKMIAVADNLGKYITIYDILTLHQKKVFHRGHFTSEIRSIVFSKYMNYCGVLSARGTLHIFCFGDEITYNQKKPYKIMKENLGKYFDYFNSEQSFAKYKTIYTGKENKDNHPSLTSDYGIPIIKFCHKIQRIKNKEKIYENEIRITYCEGFESFLGFDLKSGGDCQKISDDKRWDIDLNLERADNSSSEDEWIMI